MGLQYTPRREENLLFKKVLLGSYSNSKRQPDRPKLKLMDQVQQDKGDEKG